MVADGVAVTPLNDVYRDDIGQLGGLARRARAESSAEAVLSCPVSVDRDALNGGGNMRVLVYQTSHRKAVK